MTLLKKVFRRKSEFAKVLQPMLGFYPEQVSLYQQAFLHKSVITENELKSFESNERLEFLGDAILDSVVSHYLFSKFPFKDEGYLTQLRSRFVRRQNLNQLAKKIGLQELLKSNIEKESNAIYGDALEALIGAIYLDQGYEVCKEFIELKLFQHHLNLDEIIHTEIDFKSRVIEWCQKEKTPFSFTMTEQEVDQQKIYTATLTIGQEVKGTGQAYTKKMAEQLAAEAFYKTFN